MKRILTNILLCLVAVVAFAQEKKPTLMIVPSDNWCTQRYFTTTYDNQGTKVRVPDYQRAFQEDIEIKPVIAKVGQLLTDMGYSLKDCEQELKAISMRQAEDNVTTSKSSGASIAESPLDQLKRRTKSDIIINVDWVIRKETTGRIITFTLEAFDSYTSKRIATATGTCEPSNLSTSELLECAIGTHIKAFDKQMDNYFRDLNTGQEYDIPIFVDGKCRMKVLKGVYLVSFDGLAALADGSACRVRSAEYSTSLNAVNLVGDRAELLIHLIVLQ